MKFSADMFVQEMKEELNKNILPFWLKQMDERGGFYSLSDFSGNVDTSAPKGGLLHSRVLWTFARAARMFRGDEKGTQYYKAAQHAHNFILKQLTDDEFGGLYWMTDEAGAVTDDCKHLYNQAFGVYALAEWYDTCGEKAVLEQAIAISQKIELHARDKVNGGYMESFNRQWQRTPNQLICDTESVVSDKSMNTHLHMLEAYSRLYDVHPVEWLKESLIEMIGILTEQMLDERSSYIQFFSADWQAESKNHSYGHDIEGSWLIWEAAAKVCPEDMKFKVRKIILNMVEEVLLNGIDTNGAVLNEWKEGRYIDADKVWWAQPEGVVGFFNAYQLTGNEKYLKVVQGIWRFVQDHFVDSVNGEWHSQTDRWGTPRENAPKLEPWKCPYHNGRGCMEIIDRLEA